MTYFSHFLVTREKKQKFFQHIYPTYIHTHIHDASNPDIRCHCFTGDSLSYNRNQAFSTWDRDHNTHRNLNCVQKYKGAWWYNACHHANLNGLYLRGPHESFADGVNWKAWRGWYYSLKHVEMKIRKMP